MSRASAGPVGEVVEDRLDGGVVERRRALATMGLDVVVLHVDGEQAEGADTLPGFGGTTTPARSRMSTSRQASSEPEPPKVVSMKSRTSRPRLTDDLAQRVGLVPGRDLEDAGGAALEVEAELLGEGGDARPGGLHVERDLAAEQVGRDPAEHDVGVGDGRLGAALGVAERAGVGAGRVRADLEGALGREPGDRAAAGADGHDVDHRDLARVGADGALGGEGRLAVEDDGRRRSTCRRRRR